MYRGVALSGVQGSLMDSTINFNFFYTIPLLKKYKNSRNRFYCCGCKLLLNYRQSVTFFQKKSRLS